MKRHIVQMGLTSPLLAVALAFSAVPAFAQAESSFTAPSPDANIKLPGLETFTNPNANKTGAAHRVSMEAVLTPEGAPVKQGLTWRIFESIPGKDGKLPLLATADGGLATFEFKPGDYFIHVAFGRASVTKKLNVPENGSVEKQHLVLNAGGMVLNAVSGPDVRIPAENLTFNIYQASLDAADSDQQQLVVANVKPGAIIRLNAGTYHVVSNYGDVNAVIRSDIRVEAGKLTEAVIQHRAAKLTLKLVAEAGGEAIADTAWSILSAGGDVVSESVGAFPSMILAEGQYTAIARNKNKTYQRDFEVVAGHNADVEVLLKDTGAQANPDALD